MYTNCNDYELLYLINEGNEKALNILFDKYDYLIKMIAKEYVPYGNRCLDLAQEFRMVLFRCIKCYKSDYNISFYSYFLISINRKAKRVLNNDYYKESLLLSEPCLSYFDSGLEKESIVLKSFYKLINEKYHDKLSLDIIYECILGDVPLKQYALNKNLNYANIYYKYKKLCADIKKMLISK